MKETFNDIEDCDVFIDDIGDFSQSWEHHSQLLDGALTKLQDNGFRASPHKCKWAVQETDWLGHWLTPTGLKPWKKKFDALLSLDRPRTIKQLSSWLGSANHHHDMWPRRSHVLRPLTDLTGKGRFIWDPDPNDSIHTKAFQEMKAPIAAKAFCTHPDHNLPFKVCTDSSDCQLGAAIRQKVVPVAHHSCKLSKTQQNCSTMEKELLAIAATLDAFRSMLLGADITVNTDHKNLTCKTLTNRRCLNWRLTVKDFGAKCVHVPGKKNVLADAFSRVPRVEGKNVAVDEKDENKLEPDAHFLILDNCLIFPNTSSKLKFSGQGHLSLFDCDKKGGGG